MAYPLVIIRLFWFLSRLVVLSERETDSISEAAGGIITLQSLQVLPAYGLVITR